MRCAPCGISLSRRAPIRLRIYSIAMGEKSVIRQRDGHRQPRLLWASTEKKNIGQDMLTSGPRTATKFTPLSAAIARTSTVLLHPGGPHSNTPFGARTPRCASLSRCTRGHSTHSRKRVIVLPSPPISAKRTGGVVMACARNVDGRTVGSAAARSVAVICADSVDCGEGDARKRLMASVPASRTTAARSAPT